MQELLEACDAVGGRYLITSDHGNADDMVQRSKKGVPLMEEGRAVPLTSHTLAPVGVAVGGAGLPASIKVCSNLCQRAPSRARIAVLCTAQTAITRPVQGVYISALEAASGMVC